MTKDQRFHMRVDPGLKAEVEALAARMGTNLSTLTKMLWTRVIEDPAIIAPRPQKGGRKMKKKIDIFFKIPWKDIVLVDSDDWQYRWNDGDEPYYDAMNQYREDGTMDGMLFRDPAPGKEDLEPWEWGPAPEDIDWDGIDHPMLRAHDWDTIVGYMDDDIREELHMMMAPCAKEEFLRAYEAEHLKRYGEEYEIS